MAESRFRVDGIDHIHIFVPDRQQAAAWYREVLGMEILSDYQDSDEDGPLMISSNGGDTSLALFRTRPGQLDRPDAHRDVAFRVSGEGFIKFLQQLERLSVPAKNGKRLTSYDVVDHDYSYSLYFTDPYGNPYELTTYHYQAVRQYLREQRDSECIVHC